MPAAWQTWVPLQIDAFRGSPAVQSMAIGARAGYIYLLLALWQTEDCSLPNNRKILRQNAGMTAKEWEQYGPDVLEKFTVIESGNLRNERLYKEWLKARQIHENRRAAAQRTNAMRTTPASVTEPVTDAVSDAVTEGGNNAPDFRESGKTVNTAPQTEATMAARLMELLGLAAGAYDLDIVAQVIAFEARAAHTEPQEAAKFLLQAAQSAIQRGETVNTFWFKDRKFAQESTNGTGKAKPGVTKQRLDASRTALAEAAIKRGWFNPDGTARKDAAPVAEPGERGHDSGISNGFRATNPEILPPEGPGSAQRAADQSRTEIFSKT